MNSPLKQSPLPDVQARPDHRNLPIDAVGIKAVRIPASIRSGQTLLPTIATFSMNVSLPADAKGTHMSRFIELLEQATESLDQQGFQTMLFDMLQRLNSQSGAIEMQFPWFVTKTAPVSRVQSRLDHQVRWRASASEDGRCSFSIRVVVPATSLCPCSKEISAHGAHNQRSQISIETELDGEMPIDELIAIAERSASCEVYGLLKRADEKYVTERAYENPKFAEDLVRDVALELNADPRVLSYVVEAENFESIHNHSAFARLSRQVALTGRGRFATLPAVVEHYDAHVGLGLAAREKADLVQYLKSP
jgi:GTP cyclohydrolase FolE2